MYPHITYTPETKLIRHKIFSKYNRVSPTQLAVEIQALTGRKADRRDVHAIIVGTLKVQWLRQALAQILGATVEELWSHNYKRPGWNNTIEERLAQKERIA